MRPTVPKRKHLVSFTSSSTRSNPQKTYPLNDIRNERSVLTIFDVSKDKILSILTDLEITKSRGANKFPPVPFKGTAVEMSASLNKLYKNVKRLQKLPSVWKDATIVPVYKKGDKQLVKNYRLVSLPNIDSKVVEKCLYDPLPLHFSSLLSKNQHGIGRGRSVQTNMNFLDNLHAALEKSSSDTLVAFYTDFAKAFDRVPQYELLN